MTKLTKLNQNEIACTVGASLAFKVVGTFSFVANKLVVNEMAQSNLAFLDSSMAFGCNR